MRKTGKWTSRTRARGAKKLSAAPLGRLAKEIATLAAMREADVDTSDIPEMKDWRGAAIGKFYRPVKRSITIRLDADVLAWFKAHGGKYQTAVNKALRDYMLARR